MKTRMHSSRMRTARAFTVCRSLLLGRGCTCLVPGGWVGVPSPGVGAYLPGPGGCTWSWGVCLVLGGVPGPGGCTCLVWGVYLVPGGCTCLVPGGYLPGRRVNLVPGGVPAWSRGGCTWSGTPLLWTEWHTLMKILPCPKLRLRAVIKGL